MGYNGGINKRGYYRRYHGMMPKSSVKLFSTKKVSTSSRRRSASYDDDSIGDILEVIFYGISWLIEKIAGLLLKILSYHSSSQDSRDRAIGMMANVIINTIATILFFLMHLAYIHYDLSAADTSGVYSGIALLSLTLSYVGVYSSTALNDLDNIQNCGRMVKVPVIYLVSIIMVQMIFTLYPMCLMSETICEKISDTFNIYCQPYDGGLWGIGGFFVYFLALITEIVLTIELLPMVRFLYRQKKNK